MNPQVGTCSVNESAIIIVCISTNRARGGGIFPPQIYHYEGELLGDGVRLLHKLKVCCDDLIIRYSSGAIISCSIRGRKIEAYRIFPRSGASGEISSKLWRYNFPLPLLAKRVTLIFCRNCAGEILDCVYHLNITKM